jgi:hypothetical protein
MSRHIYIHKNAVLVPVVVPTVQIVSITNITSNGATILARVVNDGGSSITDYRFYFYAPLQPAVDVHVSPNPDGTFSYTGSTLAANTQYYLTASATNSMGSGSASQYFTTAAAMTIPVIRINSIDNISGTSADVACEVLSKGGGTVSVSGVCWNTSGSPTTANFKTTNGITEVGTFSSAMTGLVPNTRYYVRGYATNEAGTSYSAVTSFSTTAKVLILQFNTNCPATKTFTPSFAPISGTYEWDLGDGTTSLGNTTNHTYANSNTKTVKLYCTSGTPIISDLIIHNEYVIGMMDLSHSAFASLVRVHIYLNPSMNGIKLPSVLTGAVETFNLSSNGISGELYLTALVNFNSSGYITVAHNPITFIYFDNTVSGLINQIDLRDCNLGLASFTWLHRFTDNATIHLLDNPNLNSIHFGSVGHIGTLGGFDVRNCSLIDLVLGGFTGSLTASNLVWFFHDNGMSAGEVNVLLAELNSNAVNGSSGQIFISGTNAAPDTTSYNQNGVAHKAALISKGFSVYTN